jgi:WD40 repeat protein
MEGFARSLAFLVAINHYGNGVAELQTPISDAEELADVLSKEHGFEVEIWPDEKATLDGLRGLLAELPKRVSSNDRVIFYFAGHGIALDGEDGPKGFVLPQDAERSSTGRYLSMVELDAALSALSCRHMLVVLDCCFAGAFRWASFRHLALAPQNLHRERYEWFIHDAAWQAIASAAHDQKALDVASEQPLGKRDDVWKHSPFANALIQGLRGAADRPGHSGVGDGVITATELYLYLEDELLPKDVTSSRQTPMLWPLKKHDKGQFVFLVPGRKLALPDAPPLDADSNPWRALEVYEVRHKDLFYGRAEASKVLLAHVLGSDNPAATDGHPPRRFVVVTGPSGIGKSSLVRAGLLPRLQEVLGPGVLPVVTRPSRPGPDIFGSLAAELRKHESQDQLAPTAEVLRADPGALSRWCKLLESKHEVFIIVDQAEELYTGPVLDGSAADFLELIEHFLSDSSVKGRVIFIVRSEFEPQFSESALRTKWPGARYLVPRMTQDELRRVIEGPAAVKVLRFESDELVDTLLNEVISMPGGLPILSFALSQMYLNYVARRGTDRVISHLDYASLQGEIVLEPGDDAVLRGGITAALRVRADKVLDSLDEASRITARRVLERLVSVESGQFTRRRVARKEFSAENVTEATRIRTVFRRFDDARLIVTDNVAGEAYLELAHDALILGWTRLLTWVRMDAPRIAALRRLTIDTMQWDQSARQVKDLLWSDAARNVVVQDLLSAQYPGLSSVEKEFAHASLDRSKRNRRLRTATFAGLSSLAMIATFVAALYGIGVRQAEIDRFLSAARSFQSLGDSTRAYAFSLAALDQSRSWRFLSGDRRTVAESLLNSLINGGVPQVYPQFRTTFSVSLSDKGTFMGAIGNTEGNKAGRNTLMVGPPNHLENKTALGPFMAGVFRPGHEEYYAASFPDNHLVIDAFDASSGQPIKHFSVPEFQASITNVVFHGDSARSTKMYPRLVNDIAFSGDGKFLIVAGWAAPDQLGVLNQPWRAYINVENGLVEQYASPDKQVDLPYAVHTQFIAASQDGSRVASAGISTIYMDEVNGARRVVVGQTHGDLFDVAISPSGKHIVAGGASGAVTLFREMPDYTWSASELSLPGDADVELVRFISENAIVASRADYTINVSWLQLEPQTANISTPPLGAATGRQKAGQQLAFTNIRTLRGHSGKIHSLIVDPAHNRIFSAGEDREIRIWGMETGERRVLKGSERAIHGLVTSRSSEWLLSWDIGGKILAWHLPDGVSPAYTKKFPHKDFEDSIETDSYLGAGDGGSLTAFVNRLESHLIDQLEIAEKGRLVVAGYYGGPIVIWDRASDKARTLDVRNGNFELPNDGEYLSVTDTGTKAVGQVMKAREEFTRIYSTSGPAILRDDKWVTIENGTLSFHPLTDASAEKNQDMDTYIDSDEIRRFSPDGTWFVSLNKRRYCFWSSPFQDKGRCGRTPAPWLFVRSNPIFRPSRDEMITIASGKDGNRLIQINLAREEAAVIDSGELASKFEISEDGLHIAAAGRFGELYFGKAGSFSLREVGRHPRQILSMAFSSDGRWIATGGLDRAVRIWSISTFDNAQYNFLNPIEAIVFDKGNARWLVASGGSVFSVPLLESEAPHAIARIQKSSNMRVDPHDTTAAIHPVETASFQ